MQRSTRYVPTAESLGLSGEMAKSIPHPSSILSLFPVFTQSPHPHPAFPLPIAPRVEKQYESFMTIFRSAHPAHDRAMCAALHPMEPSCVKNYVRAVGDAVPSAAGLVGGWSGLVTLLRWKSVSKK